MQEFLTNANLLQMKNFRTPFLLSIQFIFQPLQYLLSQRQCDCQCCTDSYFTSDRNATAV